MLDILIKNGMVVDGSGAPAFRADVAVKDGKIARIAPEICEEAAQVIDAQGLCVSPGFIDCHTHSDYSAIDGSQSWVFLEQGVTTQVCGNCGSSPAPSYPEIIGRWRRDLTAQKAQNREEATATVEAFMEWAQRAQTGTNMAYYLGHTALRAHAVGMYAVPPTPEQLQYMQQLVERAMQAGYLGYSTGLVYTPSVYADTHELTELARVMAPYNGIYCSHIRGEGDCVLQSVAEAIEIGEKAGVPVHISHLKVMGKHNEGNSVQLLKLIDDALARGVRVTADQYPYIASSAPLRSQIPPKYSDGGIQCLLDRLADPRLRAQMDYDIFHNPQEFESGIYHAGYDGTLITKVLNTPQYLNRTVGDIARAEQLTPIEVVAKLLIENLGEVQCAYFNQNPSDMMRIMAHPKVLVGCDSSDLAGDRKDPETRGGRHPRGMGTAVRRLELTRDFNIRSLEEAVKNITFDAATALHLPGIGLLREGWSADITLFDYNALHATATFEKPLGYNSGIHAVLVNGKIALMNGRTTGVLAGRLIKRG